MHAVRSHSRSSSRFVAVMAVAAITTLLFIVAFHPGTGTQVNGGKERLTLSVVFTPTPRKEPLYISVTLGNAELAEINTIQSPWNVPIDAPKGTQLLLSATQWERGTLDCFIHLGAHQVAHDHRETGGAVKCWVNRIGR